MNKSNLNDKITKGKSQKIINLIGMSAIMFYMIVSLRNIFQVLINLSLLSANSSITSIVLNIVLYLFVVVAGAIAIRKNQNPYYQILVLVSILIIY